MLFKSVLHRDRHAARQGSSRSKALRYYRGMRPIRAVTRGTWHEASHGRFGDSRRARDEVEARSGQLRATRKRQTTLRVRHRLSQPKGAEGR
jgi:hypothetical protein